jgi:hypothetical protein
MRHRRHVKQLDAELLDISYVEGFLLALYFIRLECTDDTRRLAERDGYVDISLLAGSGIKDHIAKHHLYGIRIAAKAAEPYEVLN